MTKICTCCACCTSCVRLTPTVLLPRGCTAGERVPARLKPKCLGLAPLAPCQGLSERRVSADSLFAQAHQLNQHGTCMYRVEGAAVLHKEGG